jgi:hypothetical protein
LPAQLGRYVTCGSKPHYCKELNGTKSRQQRRPTPLIQQSPVPFNAPLFYIYALLKSSKQEKRVLQLPHLSRQ